MTQIADSFGYGVALAGNLAAVGAYLDDSNALGIDGTPDEGSPASGAVHLFTRSGATWAAGSYIKSDSPVKEGDGFGNKLAISGSTILVGAPNEAGEGLGIDPPPTQTVANAGAAYIFEDSGTTITEVTDAASFRPEISAHSWVAIKGAGLASTTRIWGAADFVGAALPLALDGTSVTIDGLPAAVYYISPTQLNVLAGALPRTGPVPVVVTTPSGSSSFMATVRTETPAWFMLDPEGRRYVAALNVDGVVVGKSGLYPAAPDFTKPLPARGRALIYGTGWGPASPAPPTGVAFSGAFPLVSTPSITIGGIPAVIEFAGVVAPGLFQFNVVAPDLPPGDHVITGTINGRSTQPDAYITIGPP
jgi:uncharacterized protein (TIGR03437 family)